MAILTGVDDRTRADNNDGPLIATVGGTRYEVYDGDTIYEVDDNNERITNRGLRIKDIQARETGKINPETGEQTFGEVGGATAKHVLASYLNQNADNLDFVNLGATQVGPGAGERDEVNFINKQTGVALSTDFAANDLSYATGWESETDYDARRAGRLRRQAAGGASEYSELTSATQGAQLNDSPSLTFKGLALDENWFDPRFHTGVKQRDHNTVLWDNERQAGGFTKDPLKTGWSVGWANVLSDSGAFLNSLGTAVGAEGLQEYGDTIRLRNAKRSQEMPPFAVSQLSDIRTNDGWWETVGDSLQWLGVNGAMSLPYMAATAGGAVIGTAATVLTGGGALAIAGGTALGVGIPSAVYAGGVWNDFDPENRTVQNIPAAYVSGIAQAVFDRIGLKGIIKPADILKKEGRAALAKAYAVKEGIPFDKADDIIRAAANDELIGLLKSQAGVAKQYLKKSKILNSTLTAITKAAPKEAVTEVLQELTAYETARRVNGEEVDPDELQNILINSAAAGFALGGAFSGAGNAIQHARSRRTYKLLTEDGQLELQDTYQNAILEAENADNLPNELRTNEGKINVWKSITTDADTNGTATPGRFNEWADIGDDTSQVKDLFYEPGKPAAQPGDDYSTDLSLTGGPTPGRFKLPGVTELGGAVLNSAARLTKAVTRYEIGVPELKNAAWRSLYQLVDFSGGGGRNFEGRKDFLKGVLDHTLDARNVLSSLGLRATNKGAKRFSQQIDALGRVSIGDKALPNILSERGFNYSKLSSVELAAVEKALGTTDKGIVNGYLTSLRKIRNADQVAKAAELQALTQEYPNINGKESNEVALWKSNNTSDNYWKATTISRAKVAKNFNGFVNYITDYKKKLLQGSTLTADQKEELRKIDPKLFAERFVNGVASDPEEGAFSLVGGKKWAANSNKKLFDFESDPTFMEKWGEENVLAGLSKKHGDVAKRVSHLEYFGDGGRTLDAMITAGYNVDAQTMGEEQAKRKASRIASDYRNLIDSSSNNYKRIQNPTVAKVQRFILGYTAIVGLSLSAPASIPEFGTVLVDLGSNKEASAALGHTMRAIKEGFIKYFKDIGSQGVDALSLHSQTIENTKGGQVVKDTMFETLEQIGIPVDVADVYNKWGLEGSEPVGDIARQLHEQFFKLVGIAPITEMQRVASGAFSLDFMRENLSNLMETDFTDTASFSRLEVESYRKLKELGMNVEKVIEALQRKTGSGSAADLSFDTQLGTKIANDAQSVFQTQEKARQAGITYEQQVEQDLVSSEFASQEDRQFVNDQIATVMQNFVNQRIQNPGSANRPLIFQDPRFALLTQFNGFIATVTTTLVPKLWRGSIGEAYRKKDPTLAYEAFAFAITMVALGALGQWMRDLIKYGEDAIDPLEHPFYDSNELILRSIGAGGIFGQFEKPFNWAFPRAFQADEALGYRVGSEFGGPALRHAENIWSGVKDGLVGSTHVAKDGGVFETPPNAAKGWNSFLKSVPITSTLPRIRQATANFLSGTEYYKDRE